MAGKIRPVNPERRGKLFERNYGGRERVEWIVGHRCAVTGRAGSSFDPIVPSHVKSRGAGGGADQVIPMLRSLEQQLHNMGIESFQLKYNVNLRELARTFDEKWKSKLSRKD